MQMAVHQHQDIVEFHVVLSLVNMVFILAHTSSACLTQNGSLAKLLLSKSDSKQVPPVQVTSTTCLEESLIFEKQGTKIWLIENEVKEAHSASLKRWASVQNVSS